MISVQEIQGYLKRIHQIASSVILSDIHVHPFEVMSHDIEYQSVNGYKGIYSSGTGSYTPPEVDSISFEKKPKSSGLSLGDALKRKMALLNFRKIYSHVGPEVLADHMSLGGIGRMLLLPVSSPEEAGMGQMDQLKEMYGEDERFSFGFSLTNDIPTADVGKALSSAVNHHKIIALKIHPNITGIDLSSSSGIERLENLLQASRATGLKVIIHGGLSPEYLVPGFSTMGSIKNLTRIDWGITDQPVIISHAGCFDFPLSEAKEAIIPDLVDMMEKHSNLLIDTSGLNYDVLEHILTKIDWNRILFGSDALYFPVWASLIKLISLLDKQSESPEEAFRLITSINANKYIFNN